MPATNPRLNLTVDRKVYRILEQLAASERLPLAEATTRLIEMALVLGEDLVCGKIAAVRQKSFRRDDALSTNDLLKWKYAHLNSVDFKFMDNSGRAFLPVPAHVSTIISQICYYGLSQVLDQAGTRDVNIWIRRV